MECGCGKGHASEFDNMCKFCREKLFRRAEAKSVDVRHQGDGMEVEQYERLMKKKKKNLI
jgi:hypothetical protein